MLFMIKPFITKEHHYQTTISLTLLYFGQSIVSCQIHYGIQSGLLDWFLQLPLPFQLA